MAIEPQALLQALQTVIDPLTGRDFVSTKALKNLQISGAEVSFEVDLGYPAQSLWPELSQALSSAAQTVAGVAKVQVHWQTRIVAHHVAAPSVPVLEQVKNIVAVASGKGGVGKSTTAVNLALALAAEGAKVGVLDADIYGPSVPTMLGLLGKKPESLDGKTMQPLIGHGLQVMSIGFLIKPDDAMIWRGPMATQALEQLLRQSNWQALDYLIVDLPPGTGDIHLTMAQRVPLTAALIVTTPQDVALQDARKGIRMFEKVGVPILGLVENMAMHVCSRCGHAEAVFGVEGGQRLAAEFGLQCLATLPLALAIREQADRGEPIVVAAPDGELAAQYRRLALRTAAALSLLGRDYSSKLGALKVQVQP